VTVTYSKLPNRLVSAANGIDYAYRDAGDAAAPLVLLQHFRGNLDSWDPALIDALAATARRSSASSPSAELTNTRRRRSGVRMTALFSCLRSPNAPLLSRDAASSPTDLISAFHCSTALRPPCGA
jgi:hypothetical protein